MKKNLLKIAGLSALVLLIHSSGYAQDDAYAEKKDTSIHRRDGGDEIIIRRKTDKDAKVTIEIKDGQVLVNGKPATEYQDDDLSIRKRKLKMVEGRSIGRGYSYSGPDGEVFISPGEPMPPMPPMPPMEPGMSGPKVMIVPSPFRNHGGVQSYDRIAANRAFLGVSSERPKEGHDGALIREITPGSAAEKAGLKPGDLITKVDEVIVGDPKGLSEAVGKYKPQDKITITFRRGDKEKKATVVLDKNKNAGAFNYDYKFDLDKDLKLPPGFNGFWNDDQPKLGIAAQDTEDGKGVKVLSVTDESAAEKAGVKEGDIIIKFDGKEVTSAPQLVGLLQDSRSKSTIQLHLLRDGKPMDIEVKVPRKLKTADL